jgi:hypothetical protein
MRVGSRPPGYEDPRRTTRRIVHQAKHRTAGNPQGAAKGDQITAGPRAGAASIVLVAGKTRGAAS